MDMGIERLKELKQQVFDDFQLYEVKMQNSFEESMKEATPTGEMDEVGNDLTDLIDAAIERQSVKSEATDHINCCPNCGWRWRERYEPPKGE